MNLDQFAASFRPAEKTAAAGAQATEFLASDVVFAAMILDATQELCRLEINGVQYDLLGDDVIDIQVIAAAHPAETKEESEAGEGTEAEQAAKKERKPVEEGGMEGPKIALIKVKANTVLTRQVQVPAVLIAAVGTWMTLVPGDCKPS